MGSIKRKKELEARGREYHNVEASILNILDIQYLGDILYN